MRWNPQNPGQHQYASDINWVDNIADMMKKYYDKFGIKKKILERNIINKIEVSTWSKMLLTSFYEYVKFNF